MFELSYEPIDSQSPVSWKAAYIPWDSETFGFNVAVLQADDSYLSMPAETLSKMIQVYAETRKVSVIVTSVPGEKQALSLLLQNTGFVHIDTAYSIAYSMDGFQCRANQITLRCARDKDIQEIAGIAEHAFQHGRYHLDCNIPVNLANQRYKDWVLRTQNHGSTQQLYIADIQGSRCGFAILEKKGREGYLHLMALAPEWRGKGLGAEIVDLSLACLKSQGANIVRSKVSALNLKALNMYISLGARFMGCEHLLHWHAF